MVGSFGWEEDGQPGIEEGGVGSGGTGAGVGFGLLGEFGLFELSIRADCLDIVSVLKGGLNVNHFLL